MPDIVKKCVQSWKKYCPDYEIRQWDESNFDVTQNEYCYEAYQAKKWAFVADYARLKVLEKYGGIYVDTDEEIIKDISPLLNYRAFAGFEENPYISMGMIGCVPHNEWIQALLSDYNKRTFVKSNGKLDLTTIEERASAITEELYKIRFDNSFQIIGDQIAILPMDYLCAKSYMTDTITITANTLAIQHFSGSWLPWHRQVRHYVKVLWVRLFGARLINFLKKYIKG